MDKSREKQLYVKINKEIQKIRDNALLIGSKAICGVVLKKAKEENKSEHERLVEIMDFCERSLGVAKKSLKNMNVLPKESNQSNLEFDISETILSEWENSDNKGNWEIQEEILCELGEN